MMRQLIFGSGEVCLNQPGPVSPEADAQPRGQADASKVDRVPYISLLAENNIRQGFFEHEQFVALREALPEEYKPIVTFAYKAGWRKAEILGLTWERVDLKEGTIRLEGTETKNKKPRTVYLDEGGWILL